MVRMVNLKEILSGIVFMTSAAVFWWQSQGLQAGTAVRMGPGYFPLILSALLAGLGMILVITGLRARGSTTTSVAWRALLLLTLCTVLFGLLLRPLGFIPTLAIVVFLSAMASRRFRLLSAILLSAGVTVFCWAVFILGLGLPLPLLGDILGGR